jgi:hypothetical protein
MNFSRRSLMIGLAAVAAVGPAITKAAVQPYASGGYIAGDVLAALFIDGVQSGPELMCNLHPIVQGENVWMQLDRALDFHCNRSGTGMIRFSNAGNPDLWVKMVVDSPIMNGCDVHVARLSL